MNTLLRITLLTLITAQAHSKDLSLRSQILAQEKAGASRLTPEIKTAFHKGILAVKESQAVKKAKQVGDKAPLFSLKNASGQTVKLDDALKKGPVILTWYRGGWCPYCNITLAALQKELPAIQKAGASLIALSPELPDKTLTTKEKNNLKFEVLTDLNHQVAKEYQLLFTLTPEVEKLYGDFFNLSKYNGDQAGTNSLPLAATYIIGKDRTILWAFLHHDYHMRAEPKEIVQFLHDHNQKK